MKKLLECIAAQFCWLFEEYGFRLVDSDYLPGFGGQGMVATENNALRICFLTDRNGRIFLEFTSPGGWADGQHASVDLLVQQFTGKTTDIAYVSDETVGFLKDRFAEIQSYFAERSQEQLLSFYKGMGEARADRLFGKIKDAT